MENKTRITVDWVITGYHRFKVKPTDGEILRLFKEPGNKFDPWAILVKQMDGTIVGRVPANFCRTLQLLKNKNIASNFKCKFTGNVNRSSTPHHLKCFKKSENGKTFDRPGGGVTLSCIYSFEIRKETREEMIEIIKANIKPEDLRRFA